ncbi:hypothetical protein PCCS19_05060 [Paenibacillus sp. CCS19]|nr:hypothetical protein PCCS19_05060 [Paenibacillus cellulosilyticus]
MPRHLAAALVVPAVLEVLAVLAVLEIPMVPGILGVRVGVGVEAGKKTCSGHSFMDGLNHCM